MAFLIQVSIQYSKVDSGFIPKIKGEIFRKKLIFFEIMSILRSVDQPVEKSQIYKK